jgi:hypothetical protein
MRFMERTVNRLRLRRYESILLGISRLLLAGCSAAPKLHTGGDQEFKGFWPQFRAAAVAEDSARLEKLTAFPFELRGTLDSKPARTYDRVDFRSLAPRLLN